MADNNLSPVNPTGPKAPSLADLFSAATGGSSGSGGNALAAQAAKSVAVPTTAGVPSATAISASDRANSLAQGATDPLNFNTFFSQTLAPYLNQVQGNNSGLINQYGKLAQQAMSQDAGTNPIMAAAMKMNTPMIQMGQQMESQGGANNAVVGPMYQNLVQQIGSQQTGTKALLDAVNKAITDQLYNISGSNLASLSGVGGTTGTTADLVNLLFANNGQNAAGIGGASPLSGLLGNSAGAKP